MHDELDLPDMTTTLDRLDRLRAIVKLLVRHGRVDLVRSATTEAPLRPETDDDDGDPEALARDLEAMGPTFVKFGQLLSTRPDLLPQHYLDALCRLQDDVAPVPVEDVRRVIESELGHRVDDMFDWFDDEPIASASLAQVHRGRLANGREVAVKVQRPDVAATISGDLDALQSVAGLVDSASDTGFRLALGDMMESFRRSLIAELDMRNEADNLEAFGRYLEGYENLRVPQPVRELTAARVLTMDFVPGKRIADLGKIERAELDLDTTADQLLRAYLDQILLHGLVHADPHPGNVIIDDDRLTLIDFGMTVRLSHRVRERMLDLVLAMAEGRADETVRVARSLGTPLDDFDESRLEREAAELLGVFESSATSRLDAGTLILELTRSCARCGLRPPAELTMVGKALLNLDQIVAVLAPRLVPSDVIRDHAASIVTGDAANHASPARMVRAALSSARLVEDAPRQVHQILTDLAQGSLEVKVNAFDQEQLLQGLEKVATRLTMGVVLAAMIIGTALAMRIESSVTIFGLPAVALVFFVLAVLGGLTLVGQTIVGDWIDRRRRRRTLR